MKARSSGVDREPAGLARQRRISRRARNRNELGMKLEIAGDMLTCDRVVMRIHHQLVEGAAREGIDTFMRGLRAVFHQYVIAFLRDYGGHEMIDKTGIDERRVG